MDSPPVEELAPELVAFWLRFGRCTVAALQVIGGLFGLYNLMFATLTGLPGRFFFLLGFVVFVASVWSGILLALDRRGGVLISLVIQTMQVFQIATDSLVYSFFCGLQLVVGLQSVGTDTVWNFGYHWPSRFLAVINPQSEIPDVNFSGVNVVAVFAIVFFLYVRSARSRALLSAQDIKPPVKDIWPPSPKI